MEVNFTRVGFGDRGLFSGCAVRTESRRGASVSVDGACLTMSAHVEKSTRGLCNVFENAPVNVKVAVGPSVVAVEVVVSNSLLSPCWYGVAQYSRSC